MRLLKILFVLSFSAIFSGCATAQIDYSGYQKILADNVSSAGVVDYSSMIKNDKNDLDKFVKQLATTDTDQLSKDQKLAYWINTYNAFTIKLIIDHWPVKSIQDIANGKPFDDKWIELNGTTYSLNQIENEKIRNQFQDARIHFAVNCAAKSCPPLFNQPFTGDHINQQLEQRTKNFINNDNYNKLSKKSVTVSKIFDWYKSDFGDIINFINKYAKTTINSDAHIRYTSYNWDLNN